jgi:hypothetical protein
MLGDDGHGAADVRASQADRPDQIDTAVGAQQVDLGLSPNAWTWAGS